MALSFASCEKQEQPIVLPPAGASLPGYVDMGEEYDKMVYFDFEKNTVVKTSKLDSWDLAFEADADGRHIFLNGGMNVTVFNTHQKTFGAVTSVPYIQPQAWGFDDPDGEPDETGIGDWCGPGGGNVHGDIYIIQLEPGKYRKIKFLSVNPQQYVIQYGEMSSQSGVTLTIPKIPDYNFTYFSFENGVVQPEPPKANWDVVFTHYKDLVYDNSLHRDVPYLVAGALLNPGCTSAGVDSSRDYASIDLNAAKAMPARADRNAIGYDWKHYDFGSGRYAVNVRKVFALHSRNGRLIKLHFLDFYSHTGVKGSPSFESEVMQ